MSQVLSSALEENSLLEGRDYQMINGEAHGLKIYRCDLLEVLSNPDLDYRCIKIDAEDEEDEQMDFLSVQIFLKKKVR